MKKTLLAAALLAATSYATAATDVTLYPESRVMAA